MYAHVNIWRLNVDGATSDDSAARVVADRLRGQRGFRSYTLVRTGEREAVVVTVFETRYDLESAMKSISEVVNANVNPLVDGAPEVRRGEVLYHVSA